MSMRVASPNLVLGAGGPVLAAAAADDSLLLRGGEASARRTSLRSSGGAGAEADGAEIKYHLVETDSFIKGLSSTTKMVIGIF